MYDVKILADSQSSRGARLTTFLLEYPRFIHAELMTHRVFSRSAASNRAIPLEKVIKKIENDTAFPVYWGKNKPGMQADEELDHVARYRAINSWVVARDECIREARHMAELGVHKQIVNRLLEPWQFITVIVSATEYKNFFDLRCSKFAQPEIRLIAERMRLQRNASSPKMRVIHLPFFSEEEWNETNLNTEEAIKVSVARCARVSYLNHYKDIDYMADFDLYDKLLSSRHMGPFEHVAFADEDEYAPHRNFIGWEQQRERVERNAS